MQRLTQTPDGGRHAADKRSPVSPSRNAHFLRLARIPRETFHATRQPADHSRLIHFLRIARGHCE
jgi:hypothetical protein